MKKLVIIIICVQVVMLAAGKLFDNRYKKFWKPLFGKLDVVIKDSAYYDGIYVGDSRVNFGINPYYIDSATGLNTYNIGMGGANVNEINFLSRQYMAKHRPPTFAVISIGYSDILFDEKFFENPCYYFFYTNDTGTNNSLQRIGYHTMLYKFLPVVKYTAFDDFNKFSIAENLQGKTFLKEGGITYKGYIINPTGNFNMQGLDSLLPEEKPIDKSMAVLEATLQLFAAKNTIPVLVYPPATHVAGKPKAPVEIKIDSAVALLARKYQLPLLHFDEDSSFTNEMFTDQWHVNIQGSVLYSQKLAGEIQSLFYKK